MTCKQSLHAKAAVSSNPMIQPNCRPSCAISAEELALRLKQTAARPQPRKKSLALRHHRNRSTPKKKTQKEKGHSEHATFAQNVFTC